MPEFHAEPYVYLAGLSHNSALIAWGAFYFRARSDGRAKLVDDEDLQWVHPPRCESIGCRSSPYGPARVEVRDEQGHLAAEALTNACNHCAIAGLKPDTRYTYTVTVKHELWGSGVRWDWDPELQGLVQRDRVYRHEFRTLPDPRTQLDRPFSFIVIGDFGTGIRKPSTSRRRQLEVAAALERAVDQYDVRLVLTTGDNIYASKRFLLWTADSGDEDDDWFFTFFQPYRYVINRVPWCPSVGNHDTRETEEHDDREQVMDNFYLRERLLGEEAAGRASVNPGLFYKFHVSSDIEFVCFDTSKEDFFRRGRLFEYPKHWDFMQRTFAVDPIDSIANGAGATRVAASERVREFEGRSPSLKTRWRIPFGHHPPFCAGPQHGNTDRMESVVSLFETSGVRVCFSGHEHNFQHSRWNGVDYFITGAGSKVRQRTPGGFESAHTRTWSSECHFLLVTIDGQVMTVRAIGESPGEALRDITRLTPAGETVAGPIVISSGA
ncbi:MAG TPA: metallophosphoesterase [Vicinamibacterales bacterium]|nr:metallophosphoesterase [Vicinamibacterales bacterium]